MDYNKFIDELDKLYYANKYPVKFYLQHSTFSYAIYHSDEAFVGKFTFESEVYFHFKDNLHKIIKDIKTERKKIINKKEN